MDKLPLVGHPEISPLPMLSPSLARKAGKNVQAAKPNMEVDLKDLHPRLARGHLFPLHMINTKYDANIIQETCTILGTV
jgi:hypothetical protein